MRAPAEPRLDDETWIDVNQHFYDPSAWRKGRAAVLSDVDLKDGYCKRMNRALQADPEGDLSAYVLFLHASERRVHDVCRVHAVDLPARRQPSAFTLAARDCGCD